MSVGRQLKTCSAEVLFMRNVTPFLAIGLFLIAACAVPGQAALKGDYLEARSSDVFTGPCFAMSEVGLTGHEAILAWKIREGDWQGVSLSGLSVVAVVRANATLGDPYHDPYPARSVLIVDSRADSQQRTALAAFAASMAGNLLEHVVRIETAPIQMTVERAGTPAMEHPGMPGMALSAGAVNTRCPPCVIRP